MKSIAIACLLVVSAVSSTIKDQCVPVDWTESQRLKVIQFLVLKLGVDAMGMRALGNVLKEVPVPEDWEVDLNKPREPFDLLGRPANIQMKIFSYAVKNIAALSPTPDGVRAVEAEKITIEMTNAGTIEFELDAEVRIQTQAHQQSKKSWLKRAVKAHAVKAPFGGVKDALISRTFRRRFVFTFREPQIRFDVAALLYRCDSSTTASWLLCTALSWGEYTISAWSSVFYTTLNYLNSETSTQKYSDIAKSLLSRVGRIEIQQVEFTARSIRLKAYKVKDSKNKNLIDAVLMVLRKRIRRDPETAAMITESARSVIMGAAQAELDRLKPLFQSKCRMPEMQGVTLGAASALSYYQYGLFGGTAMTLGFSPITYRSTQRAFARRHDAPPSETTSSSETPELLETDSSDDEKKI